MQASTSPEIFPHRKRIADGPTPDVAVRSELGHLRRVGGSRRRREPGPRRLRSPQVRGGHGYTCGAGEASSRSGGCGSRQAGLGVEAGVQEGRRLVSRESLIGLYPQRDAVTTLRDHGSG